MKNITQIIMFFTIIFSICLSVSCKMELIDPEGIDKIVVTMIIPPYSDGEIEEFGAEIESKIITDSKNIAEFINVISNSEALDSVSVDFFTLIYIYLKDKSVIVFKTDGRYLSVCSDCLIQQTAPPSLPYQYYILKDPKKFKELIGWD